MSAAPRVEVHEDAAELATAVAGELLSRLTDAQTRGEVPQIGLTGGSIAEAVHREVARLSPSSDVDWSRVVVWWGDERFVAPDDPERNAGQARAAFLDAVGVDPANVHEVPSTASAADVEEAAATYSELVHRHGAGAFEVLMLGLGPDGHVASLFPNQPTLDERRRRAIPAEAKLEPFVNRVTMTVPVLCSAPEVVFIVTGERKAEAVERAFAQPRGPATPASLIRSSNGRTRLVADAAAVSRLQS